MVERKEPIIRRRDVHVIGGAVMISVPLEWFRSHGYGNTPDEIKEKLKNGLLIVANGDVSIINPSHEGDVYKKVSKMVKVGESK